MVVGVVDIELVFVSGLRYVLGDLSFSGDFFFDDDLLWRMVLFELDIFYDFELIVELY